MTQSALIRKQLAILEEALSHNPESEPLLLKTLKLLENSKLISKDELRNR